jgi:N-acetylmuramic acid 6-phosphate etherase
MLSTAAMIRLGYVTGNRMTNVQTRNVKLHARAIRILESELGLSEKNAAVALDAAKGSLPTAIVMQKSGRSLDESKQALEQSRGVIADAVDLLKHSNR